MPGSQEHGRTNQQDGGSLHDRIEWKNGVAYLKVHEGEMLAEICRDLAVSLDEVREANSLALEDVDVAIEGLPGHITLVIPKLLRADDPGEKKSKLAWQEPIDEEEEVDYEDPLGVKREVEQKMFEIVTAREEQYRREQAQLSRSTLSKLASSCVPSCRFCSPSTWSLRRLRFIAWMWKMDLALMLDPGPYADVLEYLCFDKKNALWLIGCFSRADKDRGGSIDVHEFTRSVKWKGKNIFLERIFNLFDADQSGECDFYEWAFAMWNFCTLDPHQLDELTFELYCGEYALFHAENLNELLADIFGPKFEANPNAIKIKQDFAAASEGELDLGVDLPSFMEISNHNRELTRQTVLLQIHLRRQLAGEAAWQRLTALRERKFGRRNFKEVFQAMIRYLSLLDQETKKLGLREPDEEEVMEERRDEARRRREVQKAKAERRKRRAEERRKKRAEDKQKRRDEVKKGWDSSAGRPLCNCRGNCLSGACPCYSAGMECDIRCKCGIVMPCCNCAEPVFDEDGNPLVVELQCSEDGAVGVRSTDLESVSLSMLQSYENLKVSEQLKLVHFLRGLRTCLAQAKAKRREELMRMAMHKIWMKQQAAGTEAGTVMSSPSEIALLHAFAPAPSEFGSHHTEYSSHPPPAPPQVHMNQDAASIASTNTNLTTASRNDAAVTKQMHNFKTLLPLRRLQQRLVADRHEKAMDASFHGFQDEASKLQPVELEPSKVTLFSSLQSSLESDAQEAYHHGPEDDASTIATEDADEASLAAELEREKAEEQYAVDKSESESILEQYRAAFAASLDIGRWFVDACYDEQGIETLRNLAMEPPLVEDNPTIGRDIKARENDRLYQLSISFTKVVKQRLPEGLSFIDVDCFSKYVLGKAAEMEHLVASILRHAQERRDEVLENYTKRNEELDGIELALKLQKKKCFVCREGKRWVDGREHRCLDLSGSISRPRLRQHIGTLSKKKIKRNALRKGLGTPSCCGLGPEKMYGKPEQIFKIYLDKLESELEPYREPTFGKVFHDIFEKYKMHKGKRDIIETEMEKKLRKCSASDISIELAGIEKQVAKWKKCAKDIADFWERFATGEAFRRVSPEVLRRTWFLTMEYDDEDLDGASCRSFESDAPTEPPASPAKHWRQSLQKFSDTSTRWESRIAPTSPVRSLASVSSLGEGDSGDEAEGSSSGKGSNGNSSTIQGPETEMDHQSLPSIQSGRV